MQKEKEKGWEKSDLNEAASSKRCERDILTEAYMVKKATRGGWWVSTYWSSCHAWIWSCFNSIQVQDSPPKSTVFTFHPSFLIPLPPHPPVSNSPKLYSRSSLLIRSWGLSVGGKLNSDKFDSICWKARSRPSSTRETLASCLGMGDGIWGWVWVGG